MPCSGCSALHGMNPNQKKHQWIMINHIDISKILISNKINKTHKALPFLSIIKYSCCITIQDVIWTTLTWIIFTSTSDIGRRWKCYRQKRHYDIFVFKFFSFRNNCLQMFAIKTQHKKEHYHRYLRFFQNTLRKESYLV